MTFPFLNALRSRLGGEKRLTNWVIAAGIAGMVLIAVSEWLPEPTQPIVGTSSDTAAEASAAEYEQELGQRLEALIREVDGAGEARVMVTLAASEYTVYATDSETRTDGSVREEHLLLDEDAAEPALVETTRMPEIQGVAVLCSGADSPDIQAKVTQIVQVLTGIGANRITVERMAQQE